MSLLDRISANQKCAVVACERHRLPDTLFCRDHLAEMWANRLTRLEDGTYVPMRRFTARDETGRLAA